MAQTIEGFVGTALDVSKISPLHRRVIALIAAGYFFDVIDFTIFGSLVPYIISSKLASAPEAGLVGGFVVGLAVGGGQPLAFAYAGEYSPKNIRGRILALVHFIGGACVWPIGTALLLLFGTTLFAGNPDYAWRGVWLLIGVGALIVWVFRFTLPESPRYLATHGRSRAALDVLGRLGISPPPLSSLSTDVASDTKSDPFAVVFKMFPTRVIAGMICFTAFFGVAIGLTTWLPNIMNEKGFTITKSLQYTLAMNFAVPCASLFMMYALDKFGRKITSACAFVGAGVMAIVFANAGTPMELMVAGFVMIFFVQVAGNSMQIFASEVFPTNARASGFGWASGVGRLATAFILPSILLIQQTYSLTTVFVCLALLLLIAAASVTQLGPEAKQKGLGEIAPPTRSLVYADNSFWLQFGGAVAVLVSASWWLYFYLAAKEIYNTLPCIFWTTARCDALVTAAQRSGKFAFQPYLTWFGIALIAVGLVMSTRRPAAKTS